MDVALVALIGEHMGTKAIALHSLKLVAFTPVNVWPSCFTGTIDDMSWLDLVERLAKCFLLVHPSYSAMHIFALLHEKFDEKAANPSLSAPDEEAIL